MNPPDTDTNCDTAAAGATAAPGAPLAVLCAIPAVYLLFVAAEFLAMTHLALHLTARGVSALAVGAVASSMWLGILLASLAAHAAVMRWGHARTFVGASLVAVGAVTTLGAHQVYGGWLAGAGVLGLAGGLVWVSGEAWLAEAAPAARRGAFIGLFETSVGLGMVAGPALWPLAQALDMPALRLALWVMVAAAGCSLCLLGRAPGSAASAGSTDEGAAQARQARTAWQRVALPLALLTVLSGVLESGTSALLPSVSLRLGFAAAAAALLGAAIGAGSALLQVPAGLLADRLGLRRVLRSAWMALVLTTAALVWFADRPAGVLWPAGFVLGGVGGAVYTLAVIELGHRLRGGGLVRAMALLVTAYTAGTSVGPVLGGSLFDLGGLRLLALGLLAASLAGAALAWRQAPVPAD